MEKQLELFSSNVGIFSQNDYKIGWKNSFNCLVMMLEFFHKVISDASLLHPRYMFAILSIKLLNDFIWSLNCKIR